MDIELCAPRLRHRAAQLLRRRALHVRRGDRRHRADLAEDARRVSAAGYPTLWNYYTERGFEFDHKFAGLEPLRQGNCHFYGEHTSIDFQGYLNGAVETGECVVTEILGDFKKA